MRGGRFLLAMAVLVALGQIAFLYAMIEGRASILRHGKVVVLRVEPVDPRDLLRGDYVVLGYNISTIDAALLAGASDAEPDEARTIYVRLSPGDDGIWQPVAANLGEPPSPAPGDGEVDIRGELHTVPAENARSVFVRYGIERFYVPEGQGRPIEADITTRPFAMHVAVAADGTAQIRSFHDDTGMLFEEPLY